MEENELLIKGIKELVFWTLVKSYSAGNLETANMLLTFLLTEGGMN